MFTVTITLLTLPLPCLQRIDAQRQARQSTLHRQVRERNLAQLKTWEQNTATKLTEQQRLKHHERVKQLQVCYYICYYICVMHACVCTYVVYQGSLYNVKLWPTVCSLHNFQLRSRTQLDEMMWLSLALFLFTSLLLV